MTAHQAAASSAATPAGAGAVVAAEDRADWDRRMAELWAAIDAYERDAFVAAVDELAAEQPDDLADAVFHRGSARDSMGYPERAIPLYRRAVDLGGLTGENRRRAIIQMSSSLRNIGRPEEALALLTAERDAGSDHLDDALACTLALVLSEFGREREGLSIVITQLAKHLPRYNRSMHNYARMLVDPDHEW